MGQRQKRLLAAGPERQPQREFIQGAIMFHAQPGNRRLWRCRLTCAADRLDEGRAFGSEKYCMTTE